MAKKDEIIANKINKYWGELLNSGVFRDKRHDIFGGKMYDIEPSVNNGHLVADVLFDSKKDTGRAMRYVQDILRNLDEIESTNFLTGISQNPKLGNNVEEKLNNLALSDQNPSEYINKIVSGSNCVVQQGYIDPYKNLGERGVWKLKIKLDMKTGEDINRVIDGLNADIVDFNKEFMSQSQSLGNDNDKKIVLKFLEQKLEDHSIYNPTLNYEFYDDEGLAIENREIKEDFLKFISSRTIFSVGRSDRHTTSISFSVPSLDFPSDYKLLHADLKKVFNGNHSVVPAPSAITLDKEIQSIGTNFNMTIKGSYARLAADIKRNAPEEYQGLLKDLGMQK